MENASKALIMAGSLLIALMIIGALLLMFNGLSSYQDTVVKDKRTAQVIEFNNQFEGYNRSDVRGSDLYSLLNKAQNYNERKSYTSTTEGKEISYAPLKITFSCKADTGAQITSPDGISRLIRQEYVLTGTENDFKTGISDKVKNLENKYGATSLLALCTQTTKIFIDTPSGDAGYVKNKQEQAIEEFNNYSKTKKITSWVEIDERSDIRKDIYTYYEYIQFKRAHFECIKDDGTSGVTYDQNTGRIIEMYFKYTGTIE